MKALHDCQPELHSYLNVQKGEVVEYIGISENGLCVGILNNQIGYIQMEAHKVSLRILSKQ